MELNQFRDVDIVLDKANDNIIQKQFVSAGDKDGRSLTVQVTDNGVIGEVTGATLNLYWHNQASGLTDLSAFSVVDRTTSVFKIDYPQNMLTPGKVIAYIQILHGGKVTHTKPFEITVQKLAGTTRGVLATAEYGALVTTLAKANEFETEIAKKAGKEQVDALDNELNLKRDKSIPMGVSDMDGELLGYLKDGTGGNTINVLSIPRFQSVTPEKTNFIQTGENLFDKTDPRIKQGYYLSLSGTENTATGYYISHPIYVTAGEQITVQRMEEQGGGAYDVNDNFLQGIGTGGAAQNYYTYTVPSNTHYIRLNGRDYNFETDMVVKGNKYPDSYLPYTLTLSNKVRIQPVESKEINPLYNKIALFDGDSITFGAGWRPLKSDGKQDWVTPTGWAKIIADRNSMNVVNYGVEGATIASGTKYSKTGENRHWIGTNVPNMQSEADYIIFQGGINDYWNGVSLGSVTDGFSSVLDTSTFCGALENLFKEAQLKWKGKKLGFIISHKITTTYDIVNKNKSERYWNKAREICEKWSIPYLDLFNESGLNYGLDTIRTTYSSSGDGCHPTEAGYREFLAPKIEAWMKTL